MFTDRTSLWVLEVHINVITGRPITIHKVIHPKIAKNYEFHTNAGHLRQFLQNFPCTYDLANDTAQNNLNRMYVLR